MRNSLAALGACTLVGAAACAPVAQDAPVGVVAPAALAITQVSTTSDVVPRMDERFVGAWPDDPLGTARFANGGYLVSAKIPGEFVAIRAPLADVPRDVVVSATFRKVGGPPGGGYGLILRDQGTSSGDGVDQTGQYVVAEIGDRGDTGVWRRDVDQWIDLAPRTLSSAVRPDAGDNELTALLLGDRLTLLANGTQVADLDIKGLHTGSVGIFVGGDRNEVLVDRFRVQVPGRPAVVTAVAGQPSLSSAGPVEAATGPADSQPQPPTVLRPPARRSGRDAPIAEAQRMRDLLTSLMNEVGSLLALFSGGFDGPHSPVTDPLALKQAVIQMDQATASAHAVLAEVDRIQNGVDDGRR